MRSRLVTQRAILALLVLSFLPLGLNASSDPGDDKEKLQKELAKVEKDIKREEMRLSKKKTDVEKEYGRLMKATVQKALSSKARSIGSTWAGALGGPGKAEAIRQIKKELRTVLKDQIGANLATLLLDDLTSNLVDRITGDGSSNLLAPELGETRAVWVTGPWREGCAPGEARLPHELHSAVRTLWSVERAGPRMELVELVGG